MATNVIGTRSVVTQRVTAEKLDSTPPEGNQNPVMGKKALKKAKKDQGKDPKVQETRDPKVAENNTQETRQTVETVSSTEKNPDAEANQTEGTATERTPEVSGETNVGNKGKEKEKEKTVTFASPNLSSARVYTELQETRETIPNVREAPRLQEEVVTTVIRAVPHDQEFIAPFVTPTLWVTITTTFKGGGVDIGYMKNSTALYERTTVGAITPFGLNWYQWEPR
ncbi:hypothetical protein BJ138DRAFT_1106535 [Hygrophoropsis aurantiaca]|uniref:Uncharacterized protein n=1 Tax=Hygrophoropsis aurantiaca TaxID=72124 RepID=A0ACB7ZUD4_9AGAM|nr:hypothetical protein BJ138DRAFT_1106535 [Hygrophoropsis aurantiaca]